MCGTLRVNRHGVPPEMKNDLAKGDVCCVAIDDSMVALEWADKRRVSMLSTVHDDSIVTKTRKTQYVQGGCEEIRKPSMSEKYNQYMGESYGGFPHRTLKWWQRAFFHLLDLALSKDTSRTPRHHIQVNS